MQGHDVDGVGLGGLLVIHHQRDVFEETLQVLEFLHRAHELFQVLQPPSGVGGAVLLPHLGVAEFVQHDFGELGMRQAIALITPAVERLDQPAQRAARLRLERVTCDHRARRFRHRHAARAGVIVEELHRCIPQSALGHIDDALESEIVGRRIDEAQISEPVADFGALVKSRATDDAIRQPERDEAVFEFAHLERGAHQDGDLVERVTLVRLTCALQLLDLLADGAGFLLGIPGAGHRDFFAELVLGAQRLAEPAFVMRDQVRGGGEDVAGGAVIALEPDHFGAGKIVLEAQDVVDLGAAPAVDRLIVVADAADVFGARLHLGLTTSPWRGEVGPRQRAGRG